MTPPHVTFDLTRDGWREPRQFWAPWGDLDDVRSDIAFSPRLCERLDELTRSAVAIYASAGAAVVASLGDDHAFSHLALDTRTRRLSLSLLEPVPGERLPTFRRLRYRVDVGRFVEDRAQPGCGPIEPATREAMRTLADQLTAALPPVGAEL